MTKGNRMSKEGELHSTQREKNSDIYRDADKKFRDMSINLKVSCHFMRPLVTCVAMTIADDADCNQ